MRVVKAYLVNFSFAAKILMSWHFHSGEMIVSWVFRKVDWAAAAFSRADKSFPTHERSHSLEVLPENCFASLVDNECGAKFRSSSKLSRSSGELLSFRRSTLMRRLSCSWQEDHVNRAITEDIYMSRWFSAVVTMEPQNVFTPPLYLSSSPSKANDDSREHICTHLKQYWRIVVSTH